MWRSWEALASARVGVVWVVIGEGEVDAVGDGVGDTGRLLIALEAQVQRLIDQRHAALPDPTAAKADFLGVLAEADEQRTASMDQGVARHEHVAVAALVILDQLVLAL